jgi:hypothetical protein
MNGDAIYDLAGEVDSREKFIAFVGSLSGNMLAHPQEWENNELPTFLSGLAGFASDMSGYYKNVGEVVDVDIPTWRLMAQMLLAAKVYGS